MEAGTTLLLASHYTQNRSISRSQEQLFENLPFRVWFRELQLE